MHMLIIIFKNLTQINSVYSTINFYLNVLNIDYFIILN